MMDICERSAGGRLENANQFAGCTTKQKALRFARLSIQHPDLDRINPEQCQKRDDNCAPKGEESLK
jgi:hypothetical protein